MGLRVRRVLLLLLVGLGMAGCALPSIPYDRESAGEIRRIGLLTPSSPGSPDVILASSVGNSFGLAGALIDAGLKANRDARFVDILKAQGFTAEDALASALTGALEQRGFAVVPVSMKREKFDFAATYPADRTPQVDAYMDVVIRRYGYIAAGVGSGTPWRPNLWIKARLVKAADQTVLMQDEIMFNPVLSLPKIVTIAPDPDPQFNSFDNLEASAGIAVGGLRGAFDRTAQALGTLLKPAP